MCNEQKVFLRFIISIILIFLVLDMKIKNKYINYTIYTLIIIYNIVSIMITKYKEKFDNEYKYALQHGYITNGTVFASNQVSGLGWIL